MGIVIPLFPHISPPLCDDGAEDFIETPRRTRQPPTYKDLHGARPPGHPAVGRTYYGKVILAKNQVWVEIHSDILWAITSLYIVRGGSYPHNVIFRSLDGLSVRELSEASFRQSMKVWDEMPNFLAGIRKTLEVLRPRDKKKRKKNFSPLRLVR